MPQLADQANWAGLLGRKGVSAGTVFPADLDEVDLAKLIYEALNNIDLQQNAKNLADELSTEDGVGNACKLINSGLSALNAIF